MLTSASPVQSGEVLGVGAGRWIWTLTAFAVLGVVVPALAVTQLADAGRSDGWRISLMVAVWAGLRLALLIGSGQGRFFAFFFWLFTYLFMGVAPTVQMRSDRPSTTTPDVLPSLDAVTAALVVLGLVCFEVATLVTVYKPRRTTRTPGPGAGVRPLPAVLLVVAGLALSTYYLTRVGLTPVLTSREAVGDAREEIWPDVPTRAAVLNLSLYLTLIGAGALLQLLRRARGPLRVGYVVLVLAALSTLALVAFPVSTPRFTLGTLLFALLVLLGGAASTLRVRLTLVATAFGLFFLFPLADAFRRTDEPNFARAGLFGEYASNPDYDAIWQITNAMAYWSSGAAPVGRQALGLVLFWLPRDYWPDKPLDTGVQLAQVQGYSTSNLSAPLWAEALANGGLVALVLVFLALGWLVRRLDDLVVGALPTGGLWVVVGAVLPGYFVILLRGSLLQATGTVAIMVLCLLALRQPAGQSAGQPDGQPASERAAP